MYNTPPTVPVHFANIVFRWIDGRGGLNEMRQRTKKMADRLYAAIDRSPHFEAPVAASCRSDVTIVFRHRGAGDAFMEFCQRRGIVGIEGFPGVGGFSASLDNAMPQESVDELVRAIDEFPGFG
jgi:phosphoserine aminotransferase